MERQGFDPKEEGLADWLPEAFEVLTPLWDEYNPYELDTSFPDDDWLDPGEEWELTAEYIESRR